MSFGNVMCAVASTSRPGRQWFIRAPWPSIQLESLWHLVLSSLESAERWRPDLRVSVDPAEDARRVAEVLACDEDELQRRIALLPGLAD